jgi:hypothetical protein
MRSRLLLFAMGLLAIGLIAWGLWPLAQERLQPAGPAPHAPRFDEPMPPAAIQRMPPAGPPAAEPTQPVDVAPSDERAAEAPEAQGDLQHAAAPSGDLEHYAKRPLSAVPHRVVRGWGASEENSQLGLVGAYVVVDPGISDAQLTQLCRDIQKYHRDAKVLSVRILDSEEAATYDRHIDGGALGNRHVVASVKRDPTLGVKDGEIRVRDKLVTP